MTNHGNRQKHLNSNPLQQMLLNRFHSKITQFAQQTKVTSMLDAGCAEGFVMEHLQKHTPSLNFIGGDIDTDALLWGRDNVKHNAALTNSNLLNLPFSDNSFPLVICLEVLEHLPDSTVGLRELARVSSQYLLLSVPHEPFFRGANFLRGKHLADFGNDPEHLHNYSGLTFRQMVGGVVDVVYHSYTFPWQIILGRKKNEV